jgi:hypothetical protein
MFEYKLQERDDFNSDDTMDLCRDTETDNEVRVNGNKPEFSRYISQVNQQLLSTQNQSKSSQNKVTMKPNNYYPNIPKSPVLQNYQNSEHLQNTINHSVITVSDGKSRSRNKITRVQSRKTFKEDYENYSPNNHYYRENSENGNIHNLSRKIEFKTVDSVENQDRNEIKIEQVVNEDYYNYEHESDQNLKLTSSQPLLDQMEVLERRRLRNLHASNEYAGHANDHSIEKEPSSLYHNTTSLYHNTTEKSSQELNKAYSSNMTEFEIKKAKALKELDDIIASSEDDLGINQYLSKSSSSHQYRLSKCKP